MINRRNRRCACCHSRIADGDALSIFIEGEKLDICARCHGAISWYIGKRLSAAFPKAFSRGKEPFPDGSP
ncbi:hypothetical protein LJC32_04090 [Oscillospiraceae bacterium OttesenSCG-928-F05]|nr:hypothetical protein [Oscillospiraceae bacterium OttesenSCG-928-F05]